MTLINGNNQLFSGAVDTTLTKVFVGGLAWETPKEAMRDHFQKYGEILEAVIISDKLTGRSKGYGFVTFKDAKAAKKACDDAAPIINGRRANCNLAALGARRPRSSSTTAVTAAAENPPSQQGMVNGGARVVSSFTPANNLQWYYPATTTAPFHHLLHHQMAPFYGYPPPYIATSDVNYNHKLGFTCGAYMNGHFSQVYPSQAMLGANTFMPIYPFYQFQNSHSLGLPAHMFTPTISGPPIISKPTPPNTVCLAVE